MIGRWRAERAGLAAALALLSVAAAPAAALPSVRFTTTALGGGLFQYDLTLHNDGGAEPLSGLNLLDAHSVFGLDESSIVLAPAGWGFFEPFPPFVDELNYFSQAGASDVAVDASLGGFSFQSATSPASIGWTFDVEAIGGTSSSQIPLGGAVHVPEPATALLLGAGLAALSAGAGSPRSRRPAPRRR